MSDAELDPRSTLALYASKVIALLLLCGALLGAQQQPISQMVHVSWSAQDGAPQGIRAMAQSSDGLLWIASLGGLYTFDGVSFEPFHAQQGSQRFLAQNFHYLLISRSGDLWLFGYHGPPGRLHKGQLEVFDRVEWPYIEEFKYPHQGSDGRLWAVLNERQLVWLTADGIWRPASCPGGGSGHITMMFIDSADTTWLVVDDRLYRRSSHSQKFEPTSTYVYGDAAFEEGLHQELWISSTGSLTSRHPARHLQRVDHDGRALAAPEISEGVADAVPAGDSSLWVLTANNFLLHLKTDELDLKLPKQLREFPDQIRLNAGAEMLGSRAFFRGLDGSIWVGGLGGLEQFTNSTLVPALPGAPIGVWRSCIDSAGVLWINDPDEALYRWEKDGHRHMVDKGVGGLFCSTDGSVILRDQRGLATLSDDRVDPLPAIPGLESYTNHYMITGSARTRDGRILAAVSGRVIGRSLWVFGNQKWERYLANQEMPEVSAMYSDRTGRVLLGFRANDTIGVAAGTEMRRLVTEKPGIGTTIGFADTSYGLFAYGANGIAIDEGTHFRMLSFESAEHANSVMGLVESRDGDVWIDSSAGVVKIASPEIQHAIADSQYRLISHDIREGSNVGPSFSEFFSSKAHIDPSGRLWFTTLNGIVSVDPAVVRPSPPPLLSIRSVLADSRSMSAGGTFPPNIRILAIDYIGVDYRYPRGVSYQYKLDGYDLTWQDAGSRTEAIYTYLGPGKYTFEVMAKNPYGVWTAPVISAPFTVLPRFYQRLWFQVLCVILLALLIWLSIRARLRSIEAAIRERAEERADERIRIARDLHDTLLQGVQGLLLTFHSAAERVPETHESKVVLEKALTTADKIIIEGRDRVKGLREQNLSGKELCSALEALGNDLNTSGRIEYSVTCVESEGTLMPHIASEVFLIAREAVINAFRHAQANRISVSVCYGLQDFTLDCWDNGHGFELEAADKHTRNGHWGVRGMSERAQRLRAAFNVESEPGRGTTVHVALKAKRAYE